MNEIKLTVWNEQYELIYPVLMHGLKHDHINYIEMSQGCQPTLTEFSVRSSLNTLDFINWLTTDIFPLLDK